MNHTAYDVMSFLSSLYPWEPGVKIKGRRRELNPAGTITPER